MTKLPITVSMISGAEAGRIGRALESVAGWVSQIVVVLNEDVRDGTEEIALKHGAEVFREPWKGHIAQKNSALAKANQAWVLGLDADEAVSVELRDEIIGRFKSEAQLEENAAFSFPRLTYCFERWIRHGDWYPDRKTRLWRRGRGHWGGIDPHDKVIAEGRVTKLRANLLHYTSETIDRQLAKISRYSEDFARNCAAAAQPPGAIELFVRPPWRFFRSYVVRRGFLDGWQGYYIAWSTAFYTATRYAKAREAAATPKKTG